jgi:hypothetical protein
MASSVQWRLMFRVANRAAFDKCLARVLPLLGTRCEASEGRPYWKVPALWECEVSVPAAEGSAADRVLGCLLAARGLGSGWYILGTLSADCADGFSGVFATGQGGASSHVLGLEWASFEVVGAESAEPAAAPGPARV